MSIAFNGKSMASMMFNGKLAAQIFFGAKLIWQKITKLLQMDSNYYTCLCIKYRPTSDITLNDVSLFQNDDRSNGYLWILNSVGKCVALSTTQGSQNDVTLYGVTATLKTSSNFNAQTLHKDCDYYFCYKMSQYSTSQYQSAYYNGEIGKYKAYTIDGNINTDSYSNKVAANGTYTGGTLDNNKNFSPSEFFNSEVKSDTLFVWTGGDINNAPLNNGSYPYLANRDLSNVRGILTDDHLNRCSSDMQRLALIYYVVGQNPGAEIIWAAQYNFRNGISPNGVNMFYDGLWKIYKATSNIAQNHITSMTSITQEPTSKVLGDIYYKGQTTANDGWLDADGNPITQEMVVAWSGSEWEFARNWRYEFDTDANYDLTTAITAIQDHYANSFNSASDSIDKKYYLKINGNEV